MRYYAIGDIHGQLDMLRAAHRRIEADRDRTGDRDAPVIHLGDLVDRGPDVRGVLDFLLQGRDAGRPWQVIKGNHDRMFTRFVRSGRMHDNQIKSGRSWLDPALGGTATLASYGITASEADPGAAYSAAQAAVPEAHLTFIEGLPLYIETEKVLFVHAGIEPRAPLDWQTEDNLLWIRDGFLDWQADHPWLVVHGHTALHAPQHFGNRVDLDSGAGYGRPLSAAVIEDRDVWVLSDKGRIALVP